MVSGHGEGSVPDDHIWRYVTLAFIPIFIGIKGPLIVKIAVYRNLRRIIDLEKPYIWQFFEPWRLCLLASIIVSANIIEKLTSYSYASRLVFAGAASSVSLVLLMSHLLVLKRVIWWEEHLQDMEKLALEELEERVVDDEVLTVTQKTGVIAGGSTCIDKEEGLDARLLSIDDYVVEFDTSDQHLLEDDFETRRHAPPPLSTTTA